VLSETGPRQSGPRSLGDLSTPSVCGIVVAAVGDVVNSDPVVPRPATATELALRVFFLINSSKVQLGEVQLALDVLPVLQIAINELKEGLVAINMKFTSLADRLVKTNAALKSLDDWSIAYDFSRINKVCVPQAEKVPVVATMVQSKVIAVCHDPAMQSVGGVGQVGVVYDLVEMSIMDLDNMFA